MSYLPVVSSRSQWQLHAFINNRNVKLHTYILRYFSIITNYMDRYTYGTESLMDGHTVIPIP
jgi:hypothetical protein